MLNKPEILSPAGTSLSVKAAVNAGADAVYVGGDMFSARAFAGNFEKTELLEIIDYCHINNVKLYMAVNTLLKNNEISNLTSYMEPFVRQGVDGVIVQDMGVAQVLSKAFAELPIHGSTQNSITSSFGARYLKNLGFSRFVPARELSLKEIKDIKNNVDIEIETFVHGAMCYCYSGKCLLSSFAGHRSGNRGRCAQPCRKSYTSNGIENHIFSLKDMCMLDDLDKLIDAGIDSFKIEGRMKKPEYVAITTKAYKEVRDAYLNGEDIKPVVNEYKDFVLDIYNRGGSNSGYYFGKNTRAMLSGNRPNHEGIYIGTVESINKPMLNITLDKSVNSQDILEIRGKDSNVEVTSSVSGIKDEIISIKGKNFNNIKVGNKVYRTRNNVLLENINTNIINNTKIKTVYGYVTAVEGAPLMLNLTNPYTDNTLTVETGMVSKAENRPVTKEQIIERLCKTGGTGFEFVLDGYAADDIFIPNSTINELKRLGIDAITKDICNNYIRNNIASISFDYNKSECKILSGLTAIFNYKKDFIKINNLKMVQNIIIGYNAIDKNVDLSNYYIALPYVLRENQIVKMDEIFNRCCDAKGYLVRNFDQLGYLLDKKYEKDIILDSMLYAYNDIAQYFYSGQSQKIYMLGPDELTLSEIKELSNSISIKIYGHQLVMYSEGCYKGSYLSCNNKESLNTNLVTDELNNSFYIINDCNYCGNLIYNGLPTNIIKNYKNGEVENAYMDFTIETEEEIDSVIKMVTEEYSINNKYTKGHYFRGID